MFQGTGWDVGELRIVTGLCRALRAARLPDAPSKAQNISNYAAVPHQGGEIGGLRGCPDAKGGRASFPWRPMASSNGKRLGWMKLTRSNPATVRKLELRQERGFRRATYVIPALGTAFHLWR